MVSEKKITNGNYNDRLRGQAPKSPASGPGRSVNLASNLSGVAHDITQLAELQGQLLMVDVKEAQQKLKLPIVLAISGGILSFCAMPLLLVAAAHGLIMAGLPSWSAYGVVGVAGLLIGALLLWQSWRSMKESTLVLERSKAELLQNFDWMKQMLRNHADTARREADCQA